MDVIMEILIQYKNILIIIASFVVILFIGFLGDKRFKKKGILEKLKTKTKEEKKVITDSVKPNETKKEKNDVTVNAVLEQPVQSVETNNDYNQSVKNSKESTIVNNVSMQNTVESAMEDNAIQQENVYKDEMPISPNTQFVEYNFSPEDNINNIF